MSNEQPVVWRNRAGLRLFGILHTPSRPIPDAPTLLLLSPGVKMRVGPQRLYRRMANHFAATGFSVLRFDYHGLGDSEGSLSEEMMRDVYGQVEIGRYVHDVIDAMNWLEQEIGARRFILAGLCGGAITGLLTASRDRRAVGLLGLGMTPVVSSKSADPSVYMTQGQLADIGGTYLGKIANPTAWLRLLTFRSDYRLLWRAIVAMTRRKTPTATPTAAATPAAPASTTAAAAATQTGSTNGGDAGAPTAPDDNSNPLFPAAFFDMQRTKRPLLLIFGGADRLHFEYEEKFLARHGQQVAALPAVHTVHVIDKGNHVLTLDTWQREMLDVSSRWLDEHFLHRGVDAAQRVATPVPA